MSLISDNVIPGNHGKVFGTDAKTTDDLERIAKKVLKIKGIKDLLINSDIFPREFTIHTESLVKVKDIEDAVNKAGFHAIPKSMFTLY